MAPIELHWRASDGAGLFGRVWQPESGSVQGVVCLVHGLGEHSGRYEYLAASLNRAGYAVVTFDLRGHGMSQGTRGHSPSYGQLLDDITRLTQEARTRFSELPTFFYGHSMGGNLVLNFVLRRRPILNGVIVTGAMLRMVHNPPWWKMLFGRVMGSIWPSFTISNGLRREDLSRDVQVAVDYERDPLIHKRMSVRLGVDIYDAGLWALDHAADLSLPLLLMHGAEDRITSPDACREFAAKAGPLCTLRIWPDALHELHKAPEKEEIFAFALEWMARHR